TKRIEQLTKFQTKLMGLQAEMSSAQMKPMVGTMLVVVPIFAWLYQFISEQPYHFFSTPWNPEVAMFTSNGILNGSGPIPVLFTSVFPHWVLFYTVISTPFGMLLGKALKYYT